MPVEAITCIKCGKKYIVTTGDFVYQEPDYTCPHCGCKTNGPVLSTIKEAFDKLKGKD